MRYLWKLAEASWEVETLPLLLPPIGGICIWFILFCSSIHTNLAIKIPSNKNKLNQLRNWIRWSKMKTIRPKKIAQNIEGKAIRLTVVGESGRILARIKIERAFLFLFIYVYFATKFFFPILLFWFFVRNNLTEIRRVITPVSSCGFKNGVPSTMDNDAVTPEANFWSKKGCKPIFRNTKPKFNMPRLDKLGLIL